MRSTAERWDEVVGRWVGGHPDRLWRRHSDAVNARLLARWLPRSSIESLLKTDLFDEAIGEGLHPLLASRAERVTGIDISAQAVAAASARHPHLRAMVADVRSLPFADGTFDVIVSTSTLDHFHAADDLTRSVAELYRVLRPGGLLLLTLDNRANPLIALRNELPFSWLARLKLVPYYVGVTFGPGGTRRVLERAGFEVEECSAVLHVPRVLAVSVARWVENSGRTRFQSAFLRTLMMFERLERWPARFLSGHYVAVRASKPPVLIRQPAGEPHAASSSTHAVMALSHA